eukprot:354208-Chlamydomonas_euryale.AAC.12
MRERVSDMLCQAGMRGSAGHAPRIRNSWSLPGMVEGDTYIAASGHAVKMPGAHDNLLGNGKDQAYMAAGRCQV